MAKTLAYVPALIGKNPPTTKLPQCSHGRESKPSRFDRWVEALDRTSATRGGLWVYFLYDLHVSVVKGKLPTEARRRDGQPRFHRLAQDADSQTPGGNPATEQGQGRDLRHSEQEPQE